MFRRRNDRSSPRARVSKSGNGAGSGHSGAFGSLPDDAQIGVYQAEIDLIPSIMLADLLAGSTRFPPCPFILAVLSKGVGEGADRAGADEPARHAVRDEALTAGGDGGDDRQPRRHRFESDVAERL